jgi:hypothetical protein
VRLQVAASTLAAECPASRVDGAYILDELGRVVRERDRFTWVIRAEDGV